MYFMRDWIGPEKIESKSRKALKSIWHWTEAQVTAKIIPAVAAVTTSIRIQLVVILAFNSISAQPPHALTTNAALGEFGKKCCWIFRGKCREFLQLAFETA